MRGPPMLPYPVLLHFILLEYLFTYYAKNNTRNHPKTPTNQRKNPKAPTYVIGCKVQITITSSLFKPERYAKSTYLFAKESDSS